MPQNLAAVYSRGDLIEGRFKVLELLGEGGMGAVYKVKDTIRGGDALALKVLSKVSPGRLARFFQEAQTLRKLKSPRIVGYHGFHDSADSSPVLITEYMAGGSLEGLFDYLQEKGLTRELPAGSSSRGSDASGLLPSGLPRKLVIELIRQCAEGLMVVHKENIAHRDLKPANLLLKEPPEELLSSQQGTLKLADFGIAARNPEEEPHLTQLGSLIGTLDYAAPEYLELLIQYHRESLDGKEPGWSRSLEAEKQGDSFALGLILYRAWMGRPFWERIVTNRLSEEPDPRLPNARRALDLALSHLHADPARVLDQDPIWPVMAGLLERDPARRHSAERVFLELGELQSGQFQVAGALWSETVRSRSSRVSAETQAPGRTPQESPIALDLKEERPVSVPPPAGSARSPWAMPAALGALALMFGAALLLWRLLLDPGAVIVAFLSSDSDPTPRPPFSDGWVPTREERNAGGGASASGADTAGESPHSPVGTEDPGTEGRERSPAPAPAGSGERELTPPALARAATGVPSPADEARVSDTPTRPVTVSDATVPCQIAGVIAGPVGLQFVKIPGGIFTPTRDARESGKPVSLPSYEMALTEVTAEQYRALLGGDGGKVDPQLPKTRVTWTQAQDFVRALNQRDPSYRYQLPTEAQWELAARGTEGRRFPWGGSAPTRENRLANFAGMIEDGEDHSRLRPVGAFCGGMSPWKVLDLAGNVEEWTADCYDKTWPGSGDPARPREKCEFPEKVLRGGHYKTEAVARLEAGARRFAKAEASDPTIGFRVVRMKK